MNVNGFHPNTDPVGLRSPLDTPAKAASAQEARHASSVNPQDVARVTAALGDTYRHVDVRPESKVAYDDGGAPRNHHVPASADSASPEDAGAEIVDLETVVQARGLPLLPEKSRQSILAQEILRAYDAVHTDPQADVPVNQEDGFDTLG